MTRRSVRASVARVALLLLVLAATLAFGATAARPTPIASHDDSIDARVVDDSHALAAVPARGVEWSVNQLRSLQGEDRFFAVLLTVAALVIARRRTRAGWVSGHNRTVRGGRRTASRAPPAFV